MTAPEPSTGGGFHLPPLSPKRWPVRWRLAGVSAALTLIILVVFAVVVGRLATDRLRSNFQNEMRSTANEIAGETQVSVDALGAHLVVPQEGNLLSPNGPVAFVDSSGHPLPPQGMSRGFPDVGPPQTDVVRHVGSFDIVATPVLSTILSGNPVYVEYARDSGSLDDTINRLWLFLGLGVVGGTLLATLAGLAVAGRAMRPIAALTTTAREIAQTRDPSKRVPQPEANDEIAELARTLDQMLRELDAARTETESMIQTQREFVADASHELRTPLTSILANLELLQDQLERQGPAGEEAEIVASALRSSRRMRRLVADLLLLARADAGRTGARSEVDLAEIAAAAVDEVRPVANGRRLELHVADPIQIEGNADELHRLALNLLDNSLRHTPPGSEIDIAVERRNGHAVLEVSDDGPGLPEGMQEHLFSRFVRGEGPADVSVDSGAGLGLAIVKAVAASHGGDVEASRSPAGGARFTVTLPLGKPPEKS
jgi:two-component system, OmpR family, sensor kinase